ncbi:MAG TPA: ABC transporter substrate-binding protein, partial [Candidatus Binataceae bacterium]|nr:ABC transporter substrate-binding protein [Candidatus Binataceae bacterium]
SFGMGLTNKSRAPGRAAIIFAVIFILAPAARAADNGPVAEVRAAINEATPVFREVSLPREQRDRRLREIADKYFDFDYMARSALGRHWRSLSAAERQEFIPLFRDYVMDTYLDRLQTSTVEAAGAGLENKVAYDGPDEARVHGLLRMPQLAEPLQVDYALHKASGGWRLYDIAIDNVSTMASYRDQFNKTINEKGFAALLNELRAKRSGRIS